MAFAFVSILLASFGKLAVILCSSIFARVWVTALGLLWGNSRCPMGQWSTVAIKCAHLCVLVVLGLGLGVAGRASGWVAGRAGFWGVLATWVRGRQLQPPGS